MHPLAEIIEKNKERGRGGIYSCCSANEYVLRAALQRGAETDTYVLIEATANQVDQYGGYTGMTPVLFRDRVMSLAGGCGLPRERLILGGDHLGPLTFSGLEEEEAMRKAEELVRAYVLAGFTKIHLDTSMYLASDDRSAPLPVETVALRGARLCRVCEEAFSRLKKERPEARPPVYIIGSEVPIPGGAREHEDSVEATSAKAVSETLESYRRSFSSTGIEEAWKRVVGLVVQPGVEFGDDEVFEYDRAAARELVRILKKIPGITYEAHSTDYQTRKALREMVEDGFSILKVGPALTFALREALFALEAMERELAVFYNYQPSYFREALEGEMTARPRWWRNHYHGSAGQLAFRRAYSFSDRARYYLPEKNVVEAMEKMLGNLSSRPIPLSLLSQFMPGQYVRVRQGLLINGPEELVLDRIKEIINDYLYAVS